MKKTILIPLLTSAFSILTLSSLLACTNFLITKGASTDGSTMISYAADSHVLYGELYHWPAATYPEGTMLKVYEWDTGKYLGKIKQALKTYNVVGNINEHQVAIGETTYGGRRELGSQKGAIMDYGSLIYIALQRSKSAREAIKVIASLMEEYGYYSSGESFSISDPNEVWLMELIGKGEGEKGAVWVARMIPDGYVSGHANQARVTTFPQSLKRGAISSAQMDKIMDPKVNTIFAEDVISFARKKGFFDGKDADFSFSDTYAPVDFGGARFCEARVWSMFRKVATGMDKYAEYAKGHDLSNRMPLWVKPDKKISLQDMFGFMRDHFEGTELDMSKDIGAGPFALPYRWRPLTWEIDGVQYCNERAVATQQTGFSFISQSRNWLPNPMGGILWFGMDDASTSVYMPMFCGMTEVPKGFEKGFGSLMEYQHESAFWTFNEVANLAYTRYNVIFPEVEKTQLELENKYIASNEAISEAAAKLYKVDESLGLDFITDYSVNQGTNCVKKWRELYNFLFAKFMDGNIKKTDGLQFIDNGEGRNIPASPDQPGYGEEWLKKIINATGDHFKMQGAPGH
ncbi:MAG: dipeptidase [Bacteroidetes bacterium]|nr:dipeptidase [Bacteroidota bacterium]